MINIKYAPIGWENDPNYVYIGRTGKGLSGYYGNPIVMYEVCPVCGKNHMGRNSTLKCYEQYLINRSREDKEFYNNIKSLYGKTLVCFCKPHACHGDIIAKYTELINDNKG